MVNAATVWRARQKGNLDMLTDLMPYWAEKAYLIGLSVFNQVENDYESDDDDTEGGKKSKFQITSAGDSGAFADIFAHLQRMKAKRERQDEDDYYG